MPAFKIDENLLRGSSLYLREHGYDAVTVYDEELCGSSDVVLGDICRRENRALITADRHFCDIRSFDPAEYPGLIVLRFSYQSRAKLYRALELIISLLDREPLEGRLWIVEEDRIRIR